MEGDMVNMQNRTSLADQVFTRVANRVPGPEKEKESLVKKPQERTLFTDYSLPNLIVQLLTEPLTTLDIQLASEKTEHKMAGKMISHHAIIREAGKGNIALLYLDAEVIQDDENYDYGSRLSYFGGILANNHYKSIFVFSNGEKPAFQFKEMRRQWLEDSEIFEKAEFLLDDDIKHFEKLDKEILVSRLQDWFGLSEEADADDPEEKERANISRLRDLINEHFNEDELRNLVMDLPVEYDNLGGMNKVAKIRELVLNSKRHGYFSDLVKLCKEKRPKEMESWEEIEDSLD
jgi:hypothetical protein